MVCGVVVVVAVVVAVVVTVCGVCGADIDSCEDRDRRCEFESCDGDSDDGGSRDVVKEAALASVLIFFIP